jgi:hypothetical protein
MKKTFFYLIALSLTLEVSAQNIPSADVQIKTAVLAAPSDKQAGAKVYGYAEDGSFIIIRDGNNDFVCLADDPKKEDISVS